MSDTPQTPDFVMNPGEKTTMLFMQMVFQLSSLATMLLGKAPHPETGKITRDLKSAQLIIDQIDMLETKTKGNLNHEEEQLLRQTLMGLRMAYVEAVDQPDPDSKEADKQVPAPESTAPATPTPETPEPEPAQEEDSKKRFTKKY